jgi:hypothetical protein
MLPRRRRPLVACRRRPGCISALGGVCGERCAQVWVGARGGARDTARADGRISQWLATSWEGVVGIGAIAARARVGHRLGCRGRGRSLLQRPLRRTQFAQLGCVARWLPEETSECRSNFSRTNIYTPHSET